MTKIVLVIIFLAVGIALRICLHRQPKPQEIGTQFPTGSEQTGADVKAGVQQTGDVATKVVGEVKTDAQNVVEFTTNAAGEIKQKWS